MLRNEMADAIAQSIDEIGKAPNLNEFERRAAQRWFMAGAMLATCTISDCLADDTDDVAKSIDYIGDVFLEWGNKEVEALRNV
jgi:hypothetical protein